MSVQVKPVIYNQPIKDDEFPEGTTGHAVYTGLGLVVLAVEVVLAGSSSSG